VWAPTGAHTLVATVPASSAGAETHLKLAFFWASVVDPARAIGGAGSVARRVVHATGRARREACLTGHCGCSFSRDYARPFRFDQVRLTSIYSKGDGVVHSRCQVIPRAECVEVTGSHVVLVFNRKVYGAVAGALALPELPTDRPSVATQRGGVAEM
jgi:hypothetical protein